MTSVDPSGACSQSRGQLPVNFSSEGVDFVTVASISYIGWKRGEDYPDTALNYRKGQGKTGTFKIAPRRSRSLAHGTPDLDTFAAPFGPELVNIAAGKERCLPQLDAFAAAVRVAGEKQEQAADEATAAFAKT